MKKNIYKSNYIKIKSFSLKTRYQKERKDKPQAGERFVMM